MAVKYFKERRSHAAHVASSQTHNDDLEDLIFFISSSVVRH